MTSYDQQKTEEISVDEISHLTDDQQGEAIADHLSRISIQYQSLRTEDITFQYIPEGSHPQFSLVETRRYLENIKNKEIHSPW